MLYLTQVSFDGPKLTSAIAILMERLPGALDRNIDLAIENMENINKLGISNIFLEGELENKFENDSNKFDGENDFDSFSPASEISTSRLRHPGLHRLLDKCFHNLGRTMRWESEVTYKCSCDESKVWSALRLLPRKDLLEAVADNPVEIPVSSYIFIIINYF